MGRQRRSWGKIKKLPSGNYQASYVGEDLVRHVAPNTFSAKMDAEAWLARERRLIDLGEWEAPGRRGGTGVVFQNYAERWVAERKLRPRTAIGYRSLLRLHINPDLGDRPLKSISVDVVRAWYRQLGTEYPTRNAHAYQLLHAIMDTAVADGLIAANPVNIRGAMHAERKREPIILRADEERDEVAELADAMPAELKASVLLAAWCALRWGETSELRRADVDMETGTLLVSRAVTYRDKKYTVSTTKTRAARRVAIPPHIQPAVAEHLEKYTGKKPAALLFPGADGSWMNDQAYRKHFNEAAKAMGRPGLRVHDLRHFGGTIAARVGGTTAEVMARLGHSTVDAAMRYQAAADERDALIAASLSALVKRKA